MFSWTCRITQSVESKYIFPHQLIKPLTALLYSRYRKLDTLSITMIPELFRFVQFETGRWMNQAQWYAELGKFRLLVIFPPSFHVLRKISFSKNSLNKIRPGNNCSSVKTLSIFMACIWNIDNVRTLVRSILTDSCCVTYNYTIQLRNCSVGVCQRELSSQWWSEEWQAFKTRKPLMLIYLLISIRFFNGKL